MAIYVGLDPGKKGAMALIHVFDNPKMPYSVRIVPFDPKEYISTITDIGPSYDIKCCIEQVHSLPREGVKSVFSFGQNYGWITGILDAFGIPYQAVPPNKWKREYSLIGADKKQSIEVCHRLFPQVSLKRTERCKKDDDNFAEALLMAEYCRRKM